MIDDHVRIVDINPTQMRRFYDLFLAPRKQRRIILLHDHGRVIKAYDTGLGLRSDLRSPVPDPELRAREIYAIETGVDEVIILERSAVRQCMASWQALWMPEDTTDEYFERACRTLGNYPGGLVRYPTPYGGMRFGGFNWHEVKHFLQEWLPPDGTFLLTVFEGEDVWLSWILRLSQGRIVHISTTDGICELDARLSDWRHSYRILADRCREVFGDLSLGLFMERSAFAELVEAEQTGATFCHLVQQGAVVADPVPPRIRGLLASATGRR